MSHRAIGTLILSLCFVGTHAGAARAEFILNEELLVNGDAETGDVTGWVSDGMEIAPRSIAGTAGLPSGVDMGEFSFWGAEDPATPQTLLQTVDIGDGAEMIDAGMVRCRFGILLQTRWVGQFVDTAAAELTFLNEQGAVIESTTYVDSHVTENLHDWDLQASDQILPVGTRSIALLLEVTRNDEFSSDGLFDNASVRLSAVPEPSALLLTAIALATLAAIHRRRPRASLKIDGDDGGGAGGRT